MAATPEPEGTPGDRRPVAVLTKAMALLEQLAAEGDATPARLAELLGEPRSSVYRLLASLRELDYVEPGGRRGTYRLSLKVFALGSAVVSRYDVREAAHPVLEHLHDATGETIFLCVRRGHQAVCIDRIAGSRVALLELRLGGSMPLHLGAAPRAILAFEPEDAWEDYLAHAILGPGTDAAPHDPAAVRAELRATRARGYALSDEDVTPGIASIGAPIFDHTGRVRASLSIGGIRQLILAPGKNLVTQITGAANEVSRALGHPGANAA
jgi:DNA-binding IclR family transcriptional regulator